MIATVVNVLAILAGGTIGVLFGNKIGDKYSKGLMTVIGQKHRTGNRIFQLSVLRQ